MIYVFEIKRINNENSFREKIKGLLRGIEEERLDNFHGSFAMGRDALCHAFNLETRKKKIYIILYFISRSHYQEVDEWQGRQI